MRPTIITHTGGSIRQAIVSREETEQLKSFGDDYLRLLTGLGEDGELRGGALFATTGHLT